MSKKSFFFFFPMNQQHITALNMRLNSYSPPHTNVLITLLLLSPPPHSGQLCVYCVSVVTHKKCQIICFCADLGRRRAQIYVSSYTFWYLSSKKAKWSHKSYLHNWLNESAIAISTMFGLFKQIVKAFVLTKSSLHYLEMQLNLPMLILQYKSRNFLKGIKIPNFVVKVWLGSTL